MNTSITRKLSYLLSLFLIVGLMSCGKKKDADDEAGDAKDGAATTAVATVDMANGATISGMIKIDGAAPASKPISMDADPVCKAAHSAPVMTDHWIVGSAGEVANTFVYIKDGLGGATYAAPTATMTINQQGCQYDPHVFGVMVGQKIEIKNSDQTMHNIHAHGEKNEQFNEGQPAGTPVKEKVLDKEEVMIPIKCDVHGWMNCYAGVLKHPFFAVSGKDGKFEIKGVPPGTYTVTAWHETLDGKGMSVDQKITVAAKDSKTVDFSLKGQ